MAVCGRALPVQVIWLHLAGGAGLCRPRRHLLAGHHGSPPGNATRDHWTGAPAYGAAVLAAAIGSAAASHPCQGPRRRLDAWSTGCLNDRPDGQ
jgi:hypothetical protein